MAESVRAVDGGSIAGPADVPGVVEVKVVYTLADLKTASNYFHGSYTSAAPPLQSVASALFTSLGTAFSGNLGPQMHTLTRMIRVEVRDMASHINPVYIGTGTAVPGTGTGNALPHEIAAVLTKNVAARGRGAKGRVYLSGWVVGASDPNGSISGAVQTAINAYGTAVMNALNAQGLVPCVPKVARQQYTGLTGTTHPSRGADKVAITSMTCVNLSWDSQRRRGLK